MTWRLTAPADCGQGTTAVQFASTSTVSVRPQFGPCTRQLSPSGVAATSIVADRSARASIAPPPSMPASPPSMPLPASSRSTPRPQPRRTVASTITLSCGNGIGRDTLSPATSAGECDDDGAREHQGDQRRVAVAAERAARATAALVQAHFVMAPLSHLRLPDRTLAAFQRVLFLAVRTPHRRGLVVNLVLGELARRLRGGAVVGEEVVHRGARRRVGRRRR